MIFLFHIALSISSPAFSPVFFMFYWHASFHLVFGRLLFIFPGVSLLHTQYVFFISPHHKPVESSLRDLFGSLSLSLVCARSRSCLCVSRRLWQLRRSCMVAPPLCYWHKRTRRWQQHFVLWTPRVVAMNTTEKL